MSLNNLPSLDGVSKRLSLASMIVGRAAPGFNTISELNFEDCVEVYQGTSNTTKQRTVSEIALYPAPQDGSWIYMSLESGKRIHGKIVKPLPTSENIIDRVHELALRQGMSKMDGGNFHYTYRKNEDIDNESVSSNDSDDSKDYDENDNSDSDDDDDGDGYDDDNSDANKDNDISNEAGDEQNDNIDRDDNIDETPNDQEEDPILQLDLDDKNEGAPTQ